MKALAITVVGLLAGQAYAGRGGSVRDHRSGSGDSSVRDHRSGSDSSDSNVRDHRSEPVVRDHRSGSGSSSDAGSATLIVVDDSSARCTDHGGIVGVAPCKSFGAWGVATRFPPLSFELGGVTRRFASDIGARAGTIWIGDEEMAFQTSAPDGARDTAVATSMRITGTLARRGYLGTEVEIGGLARVAGAGAAMTGGTAATQLEQRRGFLLGWVGVGGVRVVSQERVSLALEGAAGVRTVRYRFAADDAGSGALSTLSSTRGLLEARVRGDYWLSPWASLGATLGTNVLARGDWMAGLTFSIHSRAFAGGR